MASIVCTSPEHAEGLAAELAAWRRSRIWRGLRASVKLHRSAVDAELLGAGGDLAAVPVADRGYPRVTRCKWAMRSEHVEVNHSPERKRAYYTGLCTCGSWSMCPVCASRIAAARADELAQGVKGGRARGLVVPMVTLTLRHSAGDELLALVDELNGGYRRLKMSRGYARLVARFGVDGPGRGGELKDRLYCVRSFECTWGYNGWHPHLHVLFFLRPGSDWQAFGDELRRLWYGELGGGLGVDGSPADGDLWERCVDVACSDEEVAEYVTKFGHDPSWDLPQELALSVRKSGRAGGHSRHYSMVDLLLSYMDTGNELHGRLWVEFGRVMFGRNLLTWSPGLRAYLGLLEERTDEEIAEEGDEEHVVLAQLAGEVWERVRGGRDYRAALLAIADGGDRVRVREWLAAVVSTGLPPGVGPGASERDLCEFQRGLCDG